MTGSFLPVTLEQLARERGVLYSDKITPCIQAAVGNGSSSSGTLARSILRRAPEQCIVKILGAEVTTASFALYTFSAAVFVQALVLVSFSSIADHGSNRKRLLLGFGCTGGVSSILFLFVVPKVFALGSVLVIIGVTCLGSSFVLLNSFLPLLAANDPSIQGSSKQTKEAGSGDDIPLEGLQAYDSALNTQFRNSRPQQDTPTAKAGAELELSTRISSKGVGLGYIAAVVMQLISIALLFGMKRISTDPTSQTLPLRLVLFMVGIWWLTFSLPTYLFLRDRPGPPLHASASRTRSRLRSYWTHVESAWMGLWNTIRVAAQLKQVVVFLIAWFLLSDAIATVSGTAVLFARTELSMGTIPIALLSITVMVSGIAGAFSWPVISQRFTLQTNHTIVAAVSFMEIIPLYGLLGYVPFIKAWGVGGLQQAWEIYPLGVVHGFVMGGLSSYCRSFYGVLIPPGSEAAFYALYAITDKGSSAIGPAMVGMIVDATGSIRLAFGFLALLILLPIPLMWMVDEQKGRQDAVRMSARQRSDSEPHGWEDGEEAEGLLQREG
jgi:UMF1 family MFS transporter